MAEPEFNRTARRPAPVVEDPLLQWASGLATMSRTIYAGWMVEAGKYEDIDISMDGAGFSQVTIKHGNGAIVTHWAIETANMFVVADGIQSPQELRQAQDRYGIAYGWRKTDTGRAQSVLKARVLLRELLMVGYMDPLTLTVKSTFTSDIINALSVQYSVLDAIDAFRTLDKKPALNPPFYACHIPIGPGQEVARGKAGATKEVTPPVEKVPVPVTKEYIRATWIKREWTARIEELIEPTIAWSVVESQRIAGGYAEPFDVQPAAMEESLL